MAHIRIWESFLRLNRARGSIDPITVAADLQTAGQLDEVGGLAYLVSLCDGVPRTAHIEGYAQIVEAHAIRRRKLRELELASVEILSGRDEDGIDRLRTLVQTEYRLDSSILEPISMLAERFSSPAPADIVDGLIQARRINLFVGPPRSAKTLSAQEIAAAVVTGRCAFGHLAVSGAQPCAWFTEVDDPRSFLARFDDFTDGATRSQELPFYLAAMKGTDLDDPRTQDAVVSQVSKCGAALTVFDPIRSLTACADQGPRELKPFTLFLRHLTRETNTTVLLLHHEVKPQPKDTRRGVDRISGGGILSISEAPTLLKRVSDEGAGLEATLTPTAWKHREPPPPLRVRLTTQGGRMRLVAIGADGVAPSADSDRRALDVVRAAPGLSAYRYAERLGVRRQSGPGVLERLRAQGLVIAEERPGGGLLWRPTESA
jgi:KaiC/GvpD/RAD55 family RecA-like ATPase